MSTIEALSVPIPIRNVGCQELLDKEKVGRHGHLRIRNSVNRLVESFWLSKPSSLQIRWPKTYVVVHKGCFYAYNSELSDSAKKACSLFGFSVSAVNKDELALAPSSKLTWVFKISFELELVCDEKKVFYFAAMSKSDMEGWIDHLETAISFANNSVSRSVIRRGSDWSVDSTILKRDVKPTRHDIDSLFYDKISATSDADDDDDDDPNYDTVNNATDDDKDRHCSAVVVASNTAAPASRTPDRPQVPSRRPEPASLIGCSTAAPAKPIDSKPPLSPTSTNKPPPSPISTPPAHFAANVAPPSVPQQHQKPAPAAAAGEAKSEKPLIRNKPLPKPKTTDKKSQQIHAGVLSELKQRTTKPAVPASTVETSYDEHYYTPPEDLIPAVGPSSTRTMDPFHRGSEYEQAFWSKSATEAEEYLASLKINGTYLIRNSNSPDLNIHSQALLVYYGDSVKKFRINKDKYGRVSLREEGPWFPTESNLVVFYSKNPLPRLGRLVKPWTEVERDPR